MDKYVLKLFVSGRTTNSIHAIHNLQKICQEMMKNRIELLIIDVLEEPVLAEREKIFATPTLIRHIPPPQKRLVGDLSDYQQVIKELDLLSIRYEEVKHDPS